MPQLITDISGGLRDWKVCYWLTKVIGVAAIPPSAFFSSEAAYIGENYARFCFCKDEKTLEEAVLRLRKLKPFIK